MSSEIISRKIADRNVCITLTLRNFKVIIERLKAKRQHPGFIVAAPLRWRVFSAKRQQSAAATAVDLKRQTAGKSKLWKRHIGFQ
ncbi:MAG: hypothetical protein WC637_08685 [Victivallales bacterium]|jgi:hypothetical protein